MILGHLNLVSNPPVVHEHVRLPQLVRRYPDVADAAVLGLVPPHVHVVPLLRRKEDVKWMASSGNR
jgi:hypothetical protein